MKSKPVHIIINPRSGYGSGKHMLNELCNRVRSCGFDLVEYVTQYAGDGARYARQVASEQACAVIAFGGDGTVNEIAGGLADSDVPILIAAAGTENLLAKELHLPRQPDKLAEVLTEGTIRECDMGMVNGRTFHSIIGVGFDAEVVRRVSTGRTGHISHLSYFWPIWRTFWEHNFPTLKVSADGKEVFSGKGLVFVGNISRYSSGLRICQNAIYDDGMLDLVVFKCDKHEHLIMHAAWTMLRRHPLKGNVVYRHAKHVTIESPDPIDSQVDGDIGPKTPIEVSLAPFKNRLFVPAEANNKLKFTLPSWPWKGFNHK